MGHSHSHSHSHTAAGEGTARPLAIALAVTAGFMAVEVVGGLLTHSLALLADAGHMLSDAGALAVALVAARLAGRPPDSRQTMGYQRAEVLGAGLNAGALVVLAVWIAVEAVERFGSPPEVLAKPMMVVAALGLVVNLGIFRLLSRRRDGHDHEHDLNTRAAILHVLGDALGSVGALTAGALILWRGWTWADPAASVAIAGIIVFGAVRVLREVLSVLMQAAPPGLDVAVLKAEILDLQGVCQVHDFAAWMLRPGEDVVSVHIVLEREAEATVVCGRVQDFLAERLGSAQVTVQPEPLDAPCRERAAAC